MNNFSIWVWSLVAGITAIGLNILVNHLIDKANKKKKEQFKNGRDDNGNDRSGRDNNSI